MKFSAPLIEARLIKRYKRFLVDVEMRNGELITAHTANTGAMTGCAEAGSRVWLSDSGKPARKYRYTWELVETVSESSTLVGINTQRSNTLVREAIETGVISELQGYAVIRSEVRYGMENSRIDLLLEDHKDSEQQCFVEVKNVTLFDNSSHKRIAYFPDAVTARGEKHLRELQYMVEQGQRAVIFFCVQCENVTEVQPAIHIDRIYAERLKQVVDMGVEALAYRARMSTQSIALIERVPVVIE